jgi:predicted nucleotidyltransferase
MKKQLQAIFKNQPVELAYIFGSVATGNANKESDVDIAVLLKKDISKKKRFEIRLKLMTQLSRTFQREVDLVIFNDIKSVFFKYVIIKEGNLLYGKNEDQHVEFESRIMGEYFDFAPFLDDYNKQYVKNNI